MTSVWKSVVIGSLLLPAPGTISLAQNQLPVPQVERSRPLPSTPPASSQPPAAAPSPQPESEISAEAAQRHRQLVQADHLHRQGQIVPAEALYRQAKDPFRARPEPPARPQPLQDPAQLPPAGRVYWREAQAGEQQGQSSRVQVALRLLTQEYPQFIPGQLHQAAALQQAGQTAEAVTVLERATALYPNQPQLVQAQVAAQAAAEQWLEASITARQFALLHPDDPAAPELRQQADTQLQRFRSALRKKLTGQAIAGALTGILSYGLTGSIAGPVSSIQITALMLQGESTVGRRVVERAQRQLKLAEDPELVGYVNELGQKLVQTAGRSDFEYEFYVVLDDELNAFSLPGGKVFVNTGAILRSRSEAELLGLLAHELAHSVLSHGFLLMTQSSFVENVSGGNLLAGLATLGYTRHMERQADLLGTRMLASTGYAADGLRNLMVTLQQQERRAPLTWLSEHPGTEARLQSLETLIQQNGYNRYTYEGVSRHAEIQARVRQLWADHLAAEAQRRGGKKRPETP